MGKPKMLLPFQEATILETVLKNVERADTDGIMVVLGSSFVKTEELVRNYKAGYCYNDSFRSGMLSSVQCGVKNIIRQECGYLFCLGDQPMISTEVINITINAYLSSGKGIVLPVYKGRRGHPLLVSSIYREEILGLKEEESLKTLLRRHAGEVMEVEVDDERILRDIDTPEDYNNETNQN